MTAYDVTVDPLTARRHGDVTIGVRPATTDDTDELARLRWDFRVEHGTPVTRTFEEFATEFRAFVTDALAGGARWRAWVAHADGRLVDFTVMVRPLKGLQHLITLMAAELVGKS